MGSQQQKSRDYPKEWNRRDPRSPGRERKPRQKKMVHNLSGPQPRTTRAVDVPPAYLDAWGTFRSKGTTRLEVVGPPAGHNHKPDRWEGGEAGRPPGVTGGIKGGKRTPLVARDKVRRFRKEAKSFRAEAILDRWARESSGVTIPTGGPTAPHSVTTGAVEENEWRAYLKVLDKRAADHLAEKNKAEPAKLRTEVYLAGCDATEHKKVTASMAVLQQKLAAAEVSSHIPENLRSHFSEIGCAWFQAREGCNPTKIPANDH